MELDDKETVFERSGGKREIEVALKNKKKFIYMLQLKIQLSLLACAIQLNLMNIALCIGMN